MQLYLAVYAKLGEYLYILLSSKRRDSVYSCLEVRQTALLSLYQPLSAVTVAVEDDSLVSLDVLNEQIVERCVEVVSLLKLVCEFCQGVCNDGVQYCVRTCNIQT